MRAPKWSSALLLACALVLSGCASINANSLPQPGNSYRDGYDVVLQFDNVLNLPDRAMVMMDGTQVGVVTAMATAPDRVDVTVRIDAKVGLPTNVQASLQQATVLGDIYIALDRPQTDGPAEPMLGPGDAVPVANTMSPPQLEDTIATLANFVSSGSIQRAQNTVIQINQFTPQGERARAIASQVATNLSDLSVNIETVDQWLEGVSGTGVVLNRQIPSFQDWFSEKGMTGFDRNTVTAGYVGTLLPNLGSIYANGYWLVPLLDSLGDTFGAVQRDKQEFEGQWPAWRKLWTDDFLRHDKYPAINITSVVGPDGRELSGDIQDVLRIIGAAP